MLQFEIKRSVMKSKKWEYEKECVAAGKHKLVQSKKAFLKTRYLG